MAKIYNNTNSTITIVTDANTNLMIKAEEFGELEFKTEAIFGTDTFYILEEGRFYLEHGPVNGVNYDIRKEGE